MRLAARTDANQKKIVEALRLLGCSVQVLSRVGHGCPDLVVGMNGPLGRMNFLFEIKDPDQPPSARKLTTAEFVWKADWMGQYAVVESIQDCLKVFNDTVRALK